jgi:nucleotide-binding universal stress UspA family protein
VTSKHVTAPTPSYGLIRADLLVIGCDALGWVPTAVLRRAPCSVLLARRPPDRPLLDTVLVGCGSAPIAHARAAALAAAHGSELSSVRAETITTAAAAIGAGLIVLADDAAAPHQARIAPCSVLVVRDHP